MSISCGATSMLLLLQWARTQRQVMRELVLFEVLVLVICQRWSRYDIWKNCVRGYSFSATYI